MLLRAASPCRAHIATHFQRCSLPLPFVSRKRQQQLICRAMATTQYKYVVVGGGNASGTAARTFVANGLEAGELAIIGDEQVVAYERPALSKGYLAPSAPARLPGFHTCVGSGGDRQTPEWYEEKGIAFKTDSKVSTLDVANKSITLASGDVIKYDKLILATGAKPVLLTDFKTPGADLKGVHYLRNEADAAGLVKAIEEVKASGGQAVVIGGGYIGMEVAAGLANNQIPTTIVFPEERLLSRLLTPKLGEFYEDVYKSKNITLIKKSLVTELKGTAAGQVTTAVVKNNLDGSTHEIPAQLVVVGVGARPNLDLIQGQLETVPPPVGGIKVDEYMRTSNPDVYAVGDIAAFPLARDGGKLVRQEHVTHARSSAAQAVEHILGIAKPYDYLPYFYSRIFNLSWQFWGSQGSKDAQIVHFGDVSSGKFGAYWVEGGKVIGVFLESATPEEAAAAKKLALEQPAAPSPVETLETEGLAFATSRI